jgi:ABC-type oligopeptide transport system substrate-binding subunit
MSRASLLLLGILVSVAGGCKPGLLGSAAELRVQLPAEPVTLDPSLAEDGAALRILGNTMDGLVGYDGEGKLLPLLAAETKVSADGRRYEFLLREGARWSDGEPVRAADFVRAFRRSLGPKTGSKLAGMLMTIRGAREYHAGKAGPETLGVSEGEGGRLVIELERPASYFVQSLTLPVALPQREGPWRETGPVTGAYRVASHRLERELRLEPNPHYWKAPASPGRLPVTLLVVQDESTAAALFDRGKLDVLTRIPAFDLVRLREKGLVSVYPQVATYFLSFNLRKPPFDDRELRRAVAGAVKREELVAALDGGERPARSWVPYGLEGYLPYEDPAPVFAASAEGARARLRARPPRMPVQAAFDTSGRNAMIMEKVQADLSRRLGLKISLINYDWKTYVKTIRTEAPPLYRYGWLAPFMDPISHLQAFKTGDPNNFSGWSNAEYDRLVERIERLAPGDERAALIRKAQAILVDREAAAVPLYHYVQAFAVAARVTGFRANPFGVILFAEMGAR